MKKQLLLKYSFLLLGSFLLSFTGLRITFFLAAWIPMIFFIYYFRKENKWYEYLIMMTLLFIPKFFAVHGGWDMPLVLEIFGVFFAIAPLTIALLVDKYFYKKTSSVISTLVFPATYILVSFLLGLSQFGTFSSIAITQFGFKPLLQLATVAGLGGVSFVVLWFSSTMSTLWESNFDLNKEKRLVKFFVSIFLTITILGGIYFAVSIPTGETVRIAGITVEHKSNYWNIIDMETPESEVEKYVDEIKELNDELFLKSEKVARFGAKIIFWSEANGVIYEGNKEEFVERAKALAVEHGVYFAPTVLVLRYDTFSAENKIIMINPKGEIEYEYEKTVSWYPSESDGIIDTLETPYGKLASVICFDADFPRFIRQVAKENIDILILPKIDAKAITPGHTYSGLFRGVEGGFSTVAQVSNGISVASDYRGNVLASQDFYTTEEKIMVVDVPIEGRGTIYTFLGDWFIYLNTLFLILLVGNVLRTNRGNLGE
ncbi:hypothetical protein K8R14_05080 [bacterium]|nr:hypothetical protein [bacterium]